mgnify:CR=1 FL=1
MKTKQRNSRSATLKDIPKTWDALTKMLPLRPIHDAVDFENAGEVIDLMAGHDLNKDQEDYLESVATLVGAYEDVHHAITTSHVRGLRALQSLLADHDMNASDLARLLEVHRSHGSKILNGDRALTADLMRTLGSHFKVNPSLFM